jgi:PAS domain S-box-containing protein
MDEHSIVSITDVEGNITYANQKFMDVTGFNNSELLGNKHDIINADFHDEEFYRDMWKTISSGRVWHGEIVNRAKDGRQVWMNTTIVPFMDESGRPYEYVAISTDVTGLKKIESELEVKARSLQQMTDHLEELVGVRTSELEEANKKLQNLNKLKSEFVSVVSHELRTPLTSIKSFSEILMDDTESIDIETQQRFLSIINDESERLGRLINDLLDLQKMESGKMTWNDDRVNLVEVLERSVEFFSQAFRDKGLQLILQIDTRELFLSMDADRIRQLVANLLSNALKFTDRGVVTVRMHTVYGGVSISVADTGIGIPTGELSKVFESFHQVDSSERRKIGGTGLGLAICKEIVEHYRGRIWSESQLGKGSCFSFTLPWTNVESLG